MQRQGEGPQQDQRQCDATPGWGQGGGTPGQQQTGEADKSGEGRESLKPEGGKQGKSQQEHAGPGPAGEAAEYGEPQDEPDEDIGEW